MKNFFFLLLISIFLYANNNSVKVTYIANEGFLIESDSTKILIDALFNDQTINYAHVPNSNHLKNMIFGEKTFSGIDYVFATHSHRDHFNAEVVSRFLLNNPNCKFISTSQSKAKLKDFTNFSEIENQILAFLPDSAETETFKHNNIDVKIYRFNHSKYMEKDPNTGKQINRHRNVENIGFLITVNGIKIFHNGDATFIDDAEYNNYKLNNENIDLAFLTGGFAVERGQEIFNKHINSDKVVFMHLNPSHIAQYKEAFNNSKKFIVFENPLESRNVELK